jgi:hypothetical protein
MRPIDKTEQTFSLIPKQPGMRRLPRHPIALGHLANRASDETTSSTA